MDVTAIILATVSLVLAAMSFGWQIAAWLLSAGRVCVTLKHGLMSGGSAYVGPVSNRRPRDLELMRAQGIDGPEVLAVTVANIGRAPVTVEGYEAKLIDAGVSVTPIADAIGPDLPCRMEPGTSETWYVRMESVRALVHAGQTIREGARDVAMVVELGTGKTVKTRNSIRL